MMKLTSFRDKPPGWTARCARVQERAGSPQPQSRPATPAPRRAVAAPPPPNPIDVARAEGAAQYRREAAEVLRAALAHGIPAAEAIALHEQLGHAGALEALERFGSMASASAARVYEARAQAMAADAPRPAGSEGGKTGRTHGGHLKRTTVQAGAEPVIDAQAIYKRRAVQTSGG